VTAEPPRLRLEMPFLLMAGMVVSAFVGAVGVFAAVLQAAGAFSSTQIFGQPAAPGLRSALENGAFLAYIFWLLLAAVAWGLWREQWWSRPVMVGFWALMLTMATVQYVRGLERAWSGCLPIAGLVLSASYLYGKGNVRAYYRVLESRAFPQEKRAEGGPGGVA
jgi:hypothetical protein